ncbi:class I SAM-dependent methyltransferase [Halobacillus sp. Marseille-Q1614]|uniref:class I SAM-dependent methyltransferase n=1 Tax=Halobacillus sp. Marseille-Q1614 TaxID=2709134 RepID=UPI00156EFBBD|nr:class I SAM-dependent methyltransferase [Halobacillus sp. Marseille-Q1614]
MKSEKALTINKKCWDSIAHHFDGKDALPDYGPYSQSEEELQLLGNIDNTTVLDIGCGSGHSLEYVRNKRAREVWGVDISESQIQTARTLLPYENVSLHCGPMEEKGTIPENYFDIVYSIYALGWTMDLRTTLSLVYSYLKEGGIFVFSWEHPFYPTVDVKEGRIEVTQAYEQSQHRIFESFKEDGIQAVMKRRTLSTYINELIQAGFTIEKLIEGSGRSEAEASYSQRYYSSFKASKVPATFIIKVRK